MKNSGINPNDKNDGSTQAICEWDFSKPFTLQASELGNVFVYPTSQSSAAGTYY